MLTMRGADYPPRSILVPHRHEEPAFVVVVRGSYSESMAGTEVTLAAGHMLLRPADEPHCQRFGSAGASTMILTPDRETLESLRDCGVSLEQPRCEHNHRIAQLGMCLRQEFERRDSFSRFAAEGLALELMALFGRATRRITAPPRWLATARELVSERADQPLTLRTVADRVGRHPVHLAREFRRHFGVSIGEFRRQIRLRRAEALLRTRRGLSEIALTCGFSSHSHFSHAFRTAYGVTPSEFRSRKAV
jgi:AraC family transcriptional regulator